MAGMSCRAGHGGQWLVSASLQLQVSMQTGRYKGLHIRPSNSFSAGTWKHILVMS